MCRTAFLAAFAALCLAAPAQAWTTIDGVADPQTAKPGNNMPYVGLSPEELHAVVAYLETLR